MQFYLFEVAYIFYYEPRAGGGARAKNGSDSCSGSTFYLKKNKKNTAPAAPAPSPQHKNVSIGWFFATLLVF